MYIFAVREIETKDFPRRKIMGKYVRKTKTYTCHFSRWEVGEDGMPYLVSEPVRFRVPMERYEWFCKMVDRTRPDYDWEKGLAAFDDVLSEHQLKIKRRYAKKTKRGFSSGFDD